jgi:hypothetical protein
MAHSECGYQELFSCRKKSQPLGGFKRQRLYRHESGGNQGFSGGAGLVIPYIAADGADASFHARGGACKITATKGSFERAWRWVPVATAAEQDFPVGHSSDLAASIDDKTGTGLLVFAEGPNLGGVHLSGVTSFPNGSIDAAGNFVTTGVVSAAGAVNASIRWNVSGAAANTHTWDFVADTNSLTLRSLNDASNAADTVLRATRAGVNVTSVSIGAGDGFVVGDLNASAGIVQHITKGSPGAPYVLPGASMNLINEVFNVSSGGAGAGHTAIGRLTQLNMVGGTGGLAIAQQVYLTTSGWTSDAEGVTAFYSLIENASAQKAYAFNTYTRNTGAGTLEVVGGEIDIDSRGAGAQSKTGIKVVSIGTDIATSPATASRAYSVEGNGAGFCNAFEVFPGSVTNNVIKATGSFAGYGLDFGLAIFTQAWAVVPNGSALQSVDSGGTPQTVLRVGPSNEVQLGLALGTLQIGASGIRSVAGILHSDGSNPANIGILALDIDATLSANSDARIASQKAVKSYIDNNLTGLTWKTAVLVKTTGNITPSGEQTIDGVTTSGSRVLVGSQSTASQNGIYVSAAGAWARAADADTGAELVQATVFVEKGTVNADTQWTCTNDAITLGSTSITFAQVSGAGTYSAGTGLALSGNQFAINSTVATLTGAQTLTNKTLAAPVIGDAAGTSLVLSGGSAPFALDVTTTGSVAGARVTAAVKPVLRLDTNSANAAARNYALTSNFAAFGDFAINQSITRGGDPIFGNRRIYIDAAGYTSFGGPVRPKSYTVAELPSGTAGDTAWCSNCRVFNGAGTQEGPGAGTGGLVTHNGSAWKLVGTNVTAVA